MSLFSIKKQNLLLLTLTIIVFITAFSDAEARRRSYNREKTRDNAIFILRTGSAELASLAGLSPLIDDSLLLAKKEAMLSEASEVLADSLGIEGEYGEILEELEAEDDFVVSQEEFESAWMEAMTFDEDESYDMTAGGVSKIDLMQEIMVWLGTPYRYGGTSSKGIDCSAFTQRVYRNVGRVKIPRTARTQINVAEKVEREDLEFGDLIFFHTRRRPYVSHVGIFLGDDLFAHASSRYGVTIGSLKSKYYSKRLIGGVRITEGYIANHSIPDPDIKN